MARDPAISKSIILVGALPPPIDGQSMAFRLLVRGLSSTFSDVGVVNINRPSEGFSRSRFARIFDYSRSLAVFMGGLIRHPHADVYLTVAQSRLGFVRDLAFVGMARLTCRAVTIHVHGGNYDGFYRSQPGWLRWLIRRVLLSTKSIIVLAERLRSMFDFEPRLAHRIQVVPNGLPDEAPARDRLSVPSPGEPLRVLFLSNLIESKGYLEVLEAAALLVRSGQAVEVDLCGEYRTNPSDDRRVSSTAQARRLTEEMIRSLGLEGRVHVRGIVSGAEKERALARCNVLVLPTRYDAEGQPLALIEAMAWGRPVVTTDYRGIPDLVEEGVTGYLIPSPDAASIADRLSRFATNPSLLSSMGAAARSRFEACFSGEAHVRAMIEVLSRS